MNAAARSIESYRKIQVDSSSPVGLVILLYDGALRSANEARAALLRRDVLTRSRAMSRLLGIVGELRGTLDMERGGEVAASLDGLYAFVSSRLLDASFSQDVAPLDEAVKVLKTLREGWVGAAAQSPPA